MPERLKSRKLWVVIITGVLAMVGELTGVQLDPETQQFLALTISSYLLGQSAVDYAKSKETATKYAAWMATQMNNQQGYGNGAGQYTGESVS